MRALPLLLLLSVGCASVPSSIDLPAVEPEPSGSNANLYVPADRYEAPQVTSTQTSAAQPKTEQPAGDARTTLYIPLEPTSVPALAFAEEEGLRNSRFTLKGGWYTAEDSDELDDGYIINGSWMRFFGKIFAAEIEVGYLDADGSDSGVDADLWGIPLMLNGRANLPVAFLDLYAGAGIGTIYYDVDIDTTLGSSSGSGWVFGGNAFLGASINFADRFAIGLEGKYYLTEEADDLDATLDAFALLLTIGFAR